MQFYLSHIHNNNNKKDVIKIILNDPIIKPIIQNQDLVSNSLSSNRSDLNSNAASGGGEASTDAAPKDMFEFYDNMDMDDQDGAELTKSKTKAVQLEIFKNQIETLQKRLVWFCVFRF